MKPWEKLPLFRDERSKIKTISLGSFSLRADLQFLALNDSAYPPQKAVFILM